ncbi:MAG: AAA family ATPase [Henriciella sp.]
MKLDFIEIQNFRKLKSTHIDFDSRRTLFVGANNSGKTSAIVAMRIFLLKPALLTFRDISIDNWRLIDAIGNAWEAGEDAQALNDLLPKMDIWLDVPLSEIHRVVEIVPTLDWNGGPIGVRLQVIPENDESLQSDYLEARAKATSTEEMSPDGQQRPKIRPTCLTDFLDKNNLSSFKVEAFPLDPSRRQPPTSKGVAQPQSLPEGALAFTGHPLTGLIRIDEISAQRDLSDSGSDTESSETAKAKSRSRLSDQVRSYYDKHLENVVDPTSQDVAALSAIQIAERAFDERLKTGFEHALEELAELGVPGVNNPSITFNTQLNAAEGLKHSTAIQYRVEGANGDEAEHHQLPESYAGLGYQNLISMVFRLMRYRQDWMAIEPSPMTQSDELRPLLHLVLIEEPEAHLHAQVQQVFINKAYDVLRNHDDLRDNDAYTTQLVVSTHSSHVAHEVDFANLRYFRRHPAGAGGVAPATTVANLSHTFGEEDETYRFVKRYLKATDCDLFFADAAIFVEGQAERILVPHFIRHHKPNLWRRYTSLVDLGGAHAHRFEPLVRDLGLTTLVISDLDPGKAETRVDTNGVSRTVTVAVQPKLDDAQVSTNSVLKAWHPKKETIDELTACAPEDHATVIDDAYALYVSFQKPMLDPTKDDGSTLIPRTFEDALIYENYAALQGISGNAASRRIIDLIKSEISGAELESALFDLLKKVEKAAFAIDCLTNFEDETTLQPPAYIADGLTWLENQLNEATPVDVEEIEPSDG